MTTNTKAPEDSGCFNKTGKVVNDAGRADARARVIFIFEICDTVGINGYKYFLTGNSYLKTLSFHEVMAIINHPGLLGC